jgi:protein-histidine N-methyltransferase
MTSTFSFGFAGDDIDVDETEVNDVNEGDVQDSGATPTLPELLKAQRHEMSDWVSIFDSLGHIRYILIVSYQALCGQEALADRRAIIANYKIALHVAVTNIIQQVYYQSSTGYRNKP